MKVNFDTKIFPLKGKEAIKNAYGVNDMLDALLKYGVPQEQLNAALTALTPLARTGEKKTEDLCAHHLAANALQFIGQDEKIDGARKLRWMKLAFRVMDVQPVEINDEERKLILERIEKAYPQSVLFYARMEELFEDAAAAEKAEREAKAKLPEVVPNSGGGPGEPR